MSRFTFAGTEAFRFSCFSMNRRSAAVSTCSSVAPGCTCDCPAFAFFSKDTNSGETVMWMRDLGDDRPPRHLLHRPQRRNQLLRLLARKAEEPRENFRPVLLGH
ncbi:MAG: hypothetical protein WCS72_19855, partial [Deltaproteobacteria bacterium]